MTPATDLRCAECECADGHTDDCTIGFFEAALDAAFDTDDADLNDGEDWEL